MFTYIVPLDSKQYKYLIDLVAHELPKVELRYNVLENAGLSELSTKINMHGTAEEFAISLYNILQYGYIEGYKKRPPRLKKFLETFKEVMGMRLEDQRFIESLLTIEPKIRVVNLHKHLQIFLQIFLFLVIAMILINQIVFLRKPDPVPTGFNILITGFGLINSDGNMNDDEVLEASRIFYDRLEEEISQNLEDFPDKPNIYYLPDTSLGNATDPETIERIVIQLQNEYHTNLIVSGQVQISDGLATFIPRFYVDYQGISKEKNILEGENALGAPYIVSSSFSKDNLQGSENTELEIRVQILSIYCWTFI